MGSCEHLIIAMLDDDYVWFGIGMVLGVSLTLLTQLFIHDYLNRG